MDLEAAGDRDDIRHAAVEMVFAPVLLDAQADVLHDGGQLVRPQVRMRVDEDGRVGPEAHELVQDFADVAALGGPGEELSVGESPGAAFAVAVVGVRVDDAFHRQLGHVGLAAVDVLAALQDHGLQAACQELQGGEQAGRAGADDDDRFGGVDILIIREFVRFAGLSFAVGLYAVSVQDILPGVDGTADDDGGAHLLGLDAQGLGGRFFQFGFRQFLADLLGYLEFFHTSSPPSWRRGRRPGECARRPCSGTSRRRRSSPRCRS